MTNKEFLQQVDVSNSARSLVKVLKTVGKIDNDFPKEILINLLRHENVEVRRLSIYNLGKITFDLKDVKIFFSNEKNSIVRREYISSIGRQRDEKNIKFLIKVLSDKDPKIILQSIRSLLCFKNNKSVNLALKKIKSHPNEMIKDVLEKELFSTKKVKNKDHSKVKDYLSNVTINGDVLEVLSLLDEESIHLTFTSPPYYNARDYSIYQSYKEYLDFLNEVFLNIHRVTKNGRFLIVNTSPVIEPRFSRSHSSKRYPIPFDLNTKLINQGWEFIDDIIWLKPEPSVKNRVGGFMQHRKPLGYKPNSVTEYVMVYRKKSTDLIDWNIKQYSKDIIDKSKVKGDFESSNLWKIDPVFDKSHSAIFPKKLCENIINYYSMKNDLVFDPFAGSGTVGEVALLNERKFLLTEVQEIYFKRIKEKLSNNQLKMFSSNSELNFYNLKEFKNLIKNL